MAWYDFITDRTGAIGSYIKHYQFQAQRDDVVQRLILEFPAPKETKIILKDGSVIWFDCATDVNHQWPSRVTSFPIETGVSVSDHMINENATFSVTGIFSDARMRKPDPQGNSTLEDQPLQSDTYIKLQKLRADRESFSLLTALDTYPNIVLKNMGMPRDSGTALKVVMEFEQVRLATSGTTTVSLVGGSGVKKPSTAVVPSVAPVVDEGSSPVNTRDTGGRQLFDSVGSSFSKLISPLHSYTNK